MERFFSLHLFDRKTWLELTWGDWLCCLTFLKSENCWILKHGPTEFQMQASGPDSQVQQPFWPLSTSLTLVATLPCLACQVPLSCTLWFLTATSAGSSSSMHSLNITVSPQTLISHLLISQPILPPGCYHPLTSFKNLPYAEKWLPNLHPKNDFCLEIPKYISTTSPAGPLNLAHINTSLYSSSVSPAVVNGIITDHLLAQS